MALDALGQKTLSLFQLIRGSKLGFEGLAKHLPEPSLRLLCDLLLTLSLKAFEPQSQSVAGRMAARLSDYGTQIQTVAVTFLQTIVGSAGAAVGLFVGSFWAGLQLLLLCTSWQGIKQLLYGDRWTAKPSGRVSSQVGEPWYLPTGPRLAGGFATVAVQL